MFDPHKRNLELGITLDKWEQILEDNEKVVRQLKDGMIVTEEEYDSIRNCE